MRRTGTRQNSVGIRQRRLANDLRALRQAAGFSLEEAATRSDLSVTTIYRIETAQVLLRRNTLLTLLDQYGVTDAGQRDELIDLTQERQHQSGWFRTLDEPPGHSTALAGFEAEAHSQFTYQSLLVPDLLQTVDYTRAILTAVTPSATGDELDQQTQVRLQRQTRLTGPEPLRLWAILDEAVLDRHVGGRSTMAGQLAALLDAASRPHITMQILPYHIGAHPGMQRGFTLLSFPDPDREVIHIGTLAGDLFLEQPPAIQRIKQTIEYLRAAALSPAESRQHIEKVLSRPTERTLVP